MSCKVEFTESGKIRGVLNSDNTPSTLFKQIVSNPILTLEQAIDAFKNTIKNGENTETSTRMVSETNDSRGQEIEDINNDGLYRLQPLVGENNIDGQDNLEGQLSDNSEGGVRNSKTGESNFLRGVETEGLLDQLKKTNLADNVFELSNQEIEDKLVELGVDANVAKQVVAYHGSPYSFDRFTTNAMGTGEGAQAFGWGLYFTDLEGIARNYAKVLSGSDYSITLNELKVNDKVIKNEELLKLFKDAIEAFTNPNNTVSTSLAGTIEDEGIAKKIESGEYVIEYDITPNRTKNLYKVSLHKGKEVGEYTWLEWDKPVREEMLNEVTNKNDLILDEEDGLGIPNFIVLDEDGRDVVGEYMSLKNAEQVVKEGKEEGELYTISQYDYDYIPIKDIKGKDLYKALESNFKSSKEASLLLLESGIDGIKYPAESISRGATPDNARGFNYVVFDENAITIEEKIQFQKDGITLTTNGFVHGKDVYLNKDSATDSTKVHEFNHLYSDYLKKNKKELYERGIELIEKEIALGDKSEIKNIINFVKINQPNLKGEAFSEEVLTELIGRRGAEILESKSTLGKFIDEIWSEIKNLLGLSQYTVEQVMNMTLQEYADATAVDLIRGENLLNQNKSSNFTKNKNNEQGNTEYGERRRWNQSRGNQTLQGAPINTKRKGVTGADPELTYWAEEYARRNNIPYNRQSVYVEVDENRAKRIADEYEKMEHSPQDPVVREAFNNLIEQTLAQYKILEDAGYQFYFFDETNDPYNGNPMAAMEELRNEKRMGSFATEAGFGSSATELDVKDNPMLADTGLEWGFGSVEGQKKRVLANDLFRAVHDAFGHGLEGAGFRARGEENAWQAHARLFTGSALGAITSETRGQNSWLNYGKYGEQNQTAKVEDTIFADQKTGLMPEWTWTEGFDKGVDKIAEPLVEETVSYQTPQGEEFTTYKEALKNTKDGTIKMQVGGKTIAEVDSSVDLRTSHGTINSLIKDNLLSGERTLEPNGDLVFTTEGQTENRKAVNAVFVEETAVKTFGQTRVKMLSNYNFTFDDLVNQRRIGDKVVSEKEVKEMSIEDIQKNFPQEEADALTVEKIFLENYRAFGDRKVLEEAQEYTPENELQVSLMDLLNKLGVKITSITSYMEVFTAKNGVAPSAKALADIAEKVIAFEKGEITANELTEEVSHFIVEAFDINEVENLLRNIHKTPQYTQYAEMYREIYSNEYSGAELENAVRREVLGKILAESLQANFEASQVKVDENFLNYLKRMVSEFFDKVGAYFRPEYQTQLESFQDKIFNNLLAGDLMDSLNPEQLEGNKFRLYNANAGSDPLALLAKRAEHASLLLNAQLYKIQPKDAVQKQVLVKLKEDIAKQDFVGAYAGIVSMVQRQTKYLQRSAERNRNANYVFSAEEKIVYNSLIGEMSRLLKEVKTSLVGSTTMGNETKRDLIISELEKVTQQIADLEGEVGNIESNALVNIVGKAKKRLGLSTEKADKLLDDLQGVQKETNFLHTYFGQLIHAQNAYLNIAGEVTAKTVTEARLGHLYNLKPFLNKLEAIGIDPTTLKKFAKGSYIEHIYNRTALEEAQNKAETAIYNSLADTADQVTEEQYKERFNNGKLKPLDADKAVEYSNQIRAWKEAKFAETMFTSEETKLRREKLQKYSAVTQGFEKIMSSSYADIMKNAEIVDGVPLMTREMKDDIESQRKSRTEAKSLFDSAGELRKGLKSISLEEFDENNPNHVKVGNLQIAKDSTVESDGLLAFELNQIDNEKLEQFKLKGDERSVFSDSFKEMLSKMSETEAFDFVALNSYIGYTSEYYEQTKSPETLIDRLRTAMEEQPDEADNIEAIIEEIALNSAKISNIISANKVMNNSSEVNFERMSKQKGGEVDSVLIHSEELQKAYTDAYKYLEKSERKEFENTTSTTTPNKAFADYIKDLGKASGVAPELLALEANEEQMVAVLEEVRKHVTVADRDKIDKAKYTRGQIARGVYDKISKNMAYIYKGDYSEMSEKEAKEMANRELLEYAYSKMMPYFKKTAPIGVDNILQQFEAGIISPREFIENYEKAEGDYKYLNISPNYNFQEVTNQNNLNQKFKLNKENELPQIRVFNEDGTVNQFVDMEYVNKYGIDLKQLQATGVETATKNLKDFEARKAMLDLQRNTIETAGMKGSHDIYLLPQQEMTKARKLEEFAKNNKGKGFKRIIEEFINFREDDAELGQTIDGKPVIKGFGAYSVPKYGFRKLTQSKATDELLMSYAWMNQQAHLTKARMDNIGDMLALRDTLLNANFGNKETEATRTFQMFEENLKFNYFGIKENVSKEFQVLGMKGDWAKVARTFSNWIRLRNLGFNATIPITSALTASTQLRIETIVGERLDRGAKIKADREFTKLASSAMGEIMGFNSKADLNVLGEYFGQYNNSERLENSNYSKTLRGLTRAPYILHEAGNFPVIPRVILTILYDHKFVGDQLVDFRQFKQANKGRDSGELRREWDSFTTFYDVMKVKDGLVEFDEQKISDLTGLSEADTKEFLKDRLVGLTQKVGLAVQDIDQAISPEQKSIVARHALFSFFGIHRSWLFLAAQRKFKNRHDSLASGFTEEGSWMTPFRVLNEFASDYRDGKAKEFLKYVKERWENGSDTTKKNLIRGVTEMTILNLLVGMTFLALRELGDDDEDSYLFKLSSLFLLRTTNEVASATVALPKSIYDTLENTIVGLNSLQLVSDVTDLGSSDVVQRGIYAEKTERERYLLKHIPLWKEYNALGSGIDGTIKNYNYFNFVQDGGNTKYTINLLLEDEK